MRLNLCFRLSHYVTLALACACLVQAESAYLPRLPACLAPLLGLMAGAFFAEGRWTLPAWGANLLGLVVTVGSGYWLAVQLQGPGRALPLTAVIVPHLGPLLLALLLVKLFRPRGPGNFWLVQGMGLLLVSLGCVLATT